MELGSERVANIVALGALVAQTGICDRERIAHAVKVETPRGFLDLNMDALDAGYAIGRRAADSVQPKIRDAV